MIAVGAQIPKQLPKPCPLKNSRQAATVPPTAEPSQVSGRAVATEPSLFQQSTCHRHHVLWMKSTPSRNPVQTPTSPTRTSPKPSYSQVAIRRPPEPAIKPGQQPATKENLRPRDPGKSPPHDLTRDSSRDLRALKQACDLTARDCGNLTHDLPRDWSSTRSPDRAHFLRASHPLIHMWKIVGTING